ncbi:TIGR04282 family arsenosugar biosynthesis glycosyltransferase [Geoalkalibacter sp.]|uniref:TIGR04282 family arsenosugar biosynthesis glycosyltransferase n=1 Tax=Geoalkalibacter sp. TaxID=3041440 RepID=UPI00272EBCF6|nr:TIGR04282 family arsenosugar biosynthesis glycosyltransferase [Geoalkalibacter sp.]
MENVLGIFAKQPVPGQVKTRLCPPLSPEEAAALYAVSLEETVARMTAGVWRMVIFYSGSRDYFSRVFPGVPLLAQQGTDLGARLAAALSALLAAGARAAVLIGSDSPDLPLEHVEKAFAALAGHETVLAPAIDGGYVLIGESRHHPDLFADIPWSTAEVLPLTRRRAHAAGIALHELAPWEDLDDLAALRRLLERSPDSLTARYLQTHLAQRL